VEFFVHLDRMLVYDRMLATAAGAFAAMSAWSKSTESNT